MNFTSKFNVRANKYFIYYTKSLDKQFFSFFNYLLYLSYVIYFYSSLSTYDKYCSIFEVSLSENYLISVCSEYNHVRSWRVTRFRGMISTQPGTTPKAAFKVLALEAPTAQPHNDCGKMTKLLLIIIFQKGGFLLIYVICVL